MLYYGINQVKEDFLTRRFNIVTRYVGIFFIRDCNVLIV